MRVAVVSEKMRKRLPERAVSFFIYGFRLFLCEWFDPCGGVTYLTVVPVYASETTSPSRKDRKHASRMSFGNPNG